MRIAYKICVFLGAEARDRVALFIGEGLVRTRFVLYDSNVAEKRRRLGKDISVLTLGVI